MAELRTVTLAAMQYNVDHERWVAAESCAAEFVAFTPGLHDDGPVMALYVKAIPLPRRIAAIMATKAKHGDTHT